MKKEYEAKKKSLASKSIRRKDNKMWKAMGSKDKDVRAKAEKHVARNLPF